MWAMLTVDVSRSVSFRLYIAYSKDGFQSENGFPLLDRGGVTISMRAPHFLSRGNPSDFTPPKLTIRQ